MAHLCDKNNTTNMSTYKKKYTKKGDVQRTAGFHSASILLVDRENSDIFFCIDSTKKQLDESVVAKGFAAQRLDEAFVAVALGASSRLGHHPAADSIIGSFVHPTNKLHAVFVCAIDPSRFGNPQGLHRLPAEMLLGPRKYNVNGTMHRLHPRLQYLKGPVMQNLVRLAKQAPAQGTINLVLEGDLLTLDEQAQITLM